MPAERRDAGGQFRDLVHFERHAALVVGVQANAAGALGVELFEFRVGDVEGAGDDGARPSRRFGVEGAHAVHDRGIVDAVD